MVNMIGHQIGRAILQRHKTVDPAVGADLARLGKWQADAEYEKVHPVITTTTRHAGTGLDHPDAAVTVSPGMVGCQPVGAVMYTAVSH